MAKNDDVLDDDDFEKLLNSFINSNFDDNDENVSEDKTQQSKEITKDNIEIAKSNIQAENAEDEVIPISEEGEQIEEAFADEIDDELFSELSSAKAEAEEENDKPQLGTDESELAQALINFYNSVNALCEQKLKSSFEVQFSIDDLYPNYKPSLGQIISNDLVEGWLLMVKMYPDIIGTFSPDSSDEQFLNFAETLKNQDLQLAVISYVEILIDMESCELGYQTKLLKYQEKHIKKVMYEEYLARKERQKKFTKALIERHFPIDAERLIGNYFRVAQKDVSGAFKALTTNPAIFAPIDFSKLKPKFFGLIKVTPKDGIKINIEIGNFLKKLKV